MAFITLSAGLAEKSSTGIENKFITKYLPVLDPEAVKVYIYGLYISRSGINNFTLADLAAALGIAEEKAAGYFEYLEEFELVKIIDRSPFEVSYLEAENISGTPKKFKPEKYADFAKSVQAVIKGRMISTNEYREYFYLLEEYGFEQNALLMIVNYCVNLKGDDIRVQYIKKVAKSFAAEGAVTAKKVDEKLARFTSATPSLIKIFAVASINRQPTIEDDELYKKWNGELGFSDEAICAAAKYFKAKNTQKIDEALQELYRNRKFDCKEIEFYCKNKNSMYDACLEIAKSLGVYMQNAAPYIETYINAWFDYGFGRDALKELSSYCFAEGKRTFEQMNELIEELYKQGIINIGEVRAYIAQRKADDDFIKSVLTTCGLTRRIIPLDRNSVSRWREWNFSDDMILKAAELAAGKNNPVAYMNGVLSAWKAEGIYSADKIESYSSPRPARTSGQIDRAAIERHYADLRQVAEQRAEKAQQKAHADKVYAELMQKINKLNIKLAFAESRAEDCTDYENEIKSAEQLAEKRLAELGIDKRELNPIYSCEICNDTGYDAQGKPCKCMSEFIKNYKGAN